MGFRGSPSLIRYTTIAAHPIASQPQFNVQAFQADGGRAA
jgi:hypothetical protein